MRFSILIDQPFLLKHNISVAEAALLNFIQQSAVWAEFHDGGWFWISFAVIQNELPYFFKNKVAITRARQALESKGLIEQKMFKNKNLYKLTDASKMYGGNYNPADFVEKIAEKKVSEVKSKVVKKSSTAIKKDVSTGIKNDTPCDSTGIKFDTSTGIKNDTQLYKNRLYKNNNNNIVVQNEKSDFENFAEQAVNYLNFVIGTSYSPKTKDTEKFLKAIYKLKFSIDDVKSVIDSKVSEWRNDAIMSKYLRPSTLFNPNKFQTYHETTKQCIITPIGNNSLPNQPKQTGFMERHWDNQWAADLLDSDKPF